MNLPPMNLAIEDVYKLLGEKDILIYQVSEAFNKIAAENMELKQQIEALKNGKLEQSTPDDSVRRVLSGVQGEGRRFGDDVLKSPDQSPGGVGALQQVNKNL